MAASETADEMRRWWAGLGDDQVRWLHAYQNGPNRQLADSLPAEHRPNGGDEWIGLGGYEGDPGNAELFFATEFREFLAEQYDRSVGGGGL